MDTIVYKDQCWARTGSMNTCPDFRGGYSWSRDLAGCMDAPEYVASGSTVKNVVEELDEIAVAGGLAYRY